jgi:predicted membrane-bound spermidine synthase
MRPFMRPARPTGPPASRPASARSSASRASFPSALLAAFVISGLAGLIYESIWSRYVALLVGHGAYAQVLVLVTFMAGMAGGALAVARRSEALANPLRIYAAVEAAIGVLGLAFHPIFVTTTGLAYDRWFPALGGTAGVPIVQWGLAVLLLLPQSLLLGATFPLMSAAFVRRAPRAQGRALALLYFTNSLGAAAGGLLSGFWLVGWVGLPGTVFAAALLNLLVAGIAFRASRGAAYASAVRPADAPPAAEESRGPSAAPLLIGVAFGTAVASFVYEIAWIRMLSLVLGSATHSFELMLSAFILGLALGAFWVRTRADRFPHPLRALGVTQWAMGALALATLPIYAASFHWMSGIVRGLPPTASGYQQFSLARYGLCLAVMLPATCCAGVTLPLLTRALMTAGGGERAIGVVYGANTLGSITGALLAGLVLLPWLGLHRLLVAGALLDMALGALLLGRAETRPSRRAALPALGAAIAAAILALTLVRLDRLTLVSGVYRTGHLLDPAGNQMVFYRDGRTATVSVRRQLSDGMLTLSTNGKPDASVPQRWREPGPPPPAQLDDDESTQLLLALMSLAHVPQAKRAAVIGQGSGITSHVLLGSSRLEHLVTIEIEPDMIAASRAFSPANQRVFGDPRSRFVIDDARSYLAATPERFDLIVSEPSNPWVSGVAGLFSDEFYARVAAKLTPAGVMGQWLHLYSLDDDLALGVLAGIHRHFSDYRAYLVSSSDMLIVASNRVGGLKPDWSIAGEPGFARDLAHTYPFTPRIFEALRVAGRETLGPLLGRVRPNSDYFPALDLGAERARFEQRTAQGFLQLHEDRFGIAAAFAPRVDPPPDVFVPVPRAARVRSLMWIARLRSALSGAEPPHGGPSDFGGRLPEAVARQQAIFASCASNAPPADWRVWLGEALRGENERHTGTTGYADEDYFSVLLRYAREQHAPVEVGRILELVRALDRADFSNASALTDSLLGAALSPEPWFTPQGLLDGGVMAKLGARDTAGARRIYEVLGPRSGRPATDLRSRLMAARFGAP